MNDLVIKHLGQHGVEIRYSGNHAQMRRYLEHLKNEIRMTKQFLKDDKNAKPVDEPRN